MSRASARRPQVKSGDAMSAGASAISTWLPVVLLVLAFVAPGAWLVTVLPPLPVAKALTLGTVAVWLLALALGGAGLGRPDRRIALGVGAVLVSVGASWVLGGSWAQVVLYDLFGNMPLLLWLAFPAVFVLSSGVSWRRPDVWRAWEVVAVIGAVLAVVLAHQQLTMHGNTVFGTTAYSVTALVALIPVGIAAALRQTGAWRLVALVVPLAIAVSLAVFSASLMGTVAVAFALLVSVVAQPALWRSKRRLARGLATFSAGLATVMVLGILFVQVPLVSGRWVTTRAVGSLGKNVVSRVQLWQGAQAMVANKPVFGYGPSGYRLAAAEYLVPEALQFGPDVAGNADPTVYAPQSPHSLLWEILTRLGFVGLLAFCGLLVAWALVLRERLRADDAAALRAAAAASFLCALFALSVNPVVFPIGLFAATSAGLAVAPLAPQRGRSAAGDAGFSAGVGLRGVLAACGVVVLAIAVWLGVGEMRAYQAPSDSVASSIANYESVLRFLPGHPITQRRLLENRLLIAENADAVIAAQQAIDAAPAYQRAFAPDLVNFVAYSLAQADRTGRQGLVWEARLLADAQARIPRTPSLVAERLHLALAEGDREAVAATIDDARALGAPYPYTAAYLKRAEELLATPAR